MDALTTVSLNLEFGATEILTAVLVVVTGFYAWQTFEMVKEMRQARQASLMPVLGVDMMPRAPTYCEVRLRNNGLGPAFHVDLTIRFVGRSAETIEGPFRADVVPPGHEHLFITPRDLGTEEFVEVYSHIEVSGTIQDAFGTEHKVSTRTGDLATWWESRGEPINERWVPNEFEEMHRVVKKIQEHLDGQTKATKDLADVATGRAKLLRKRYRSRQRARRIERLKKRLRAVAPF